jgi:hypothetical protein
MEKIKQLLSNSKNIHLTLSWIIRIAILALIIRLTFWSNTVIKNVYTEESELHDSLIVLNERLKQLEKQDSTHKYERDKALSRVDSLSIDDIHREITNRIRQR